MRTFFLLLALGLLASVVSGAALSYDGAYYMFEVTDTGIPLAPYSRLPDLLLHYPVVLMRRLTSNAGALITVFGTLHVIFPLLSLLLCWIIVRRFRPSLFYWPAIGVCIATLPGQFDFVSEAIAEVQLFWPLLLWILVGMPAYFLPAIIVIVPMLFFLHPASAPLFAMTAFVVLAVGWACKMPWWKPALTTLVCCTLAVTRYEMIRAGYESQQLSVSSQSQAIRDSLLGLPLAALLCGVACSCAYFLLLHANSAHAARRLVVGGCYMSLLGCFLLLVQWARHGQSWQGSIAYKDLALFADLPFMGLAILDVLLTYRASLARAFKHALRRAIRLGEGEETGNSRTDSVTATWHCVWLVRGFAAVFTTTLFLQGRVFVVATDGVRSVMHMSDSSCVSMNDIPDIYNTALNFWSLPVYMAVIQGRSTHVLVLTGDACVPARLHGQVQLISFDTSTTGKGWMSLNPARALLRKPMPCWFAMYPNWLPLETDEQGWLRWTAGTGEIHVYLARPGVVTVDGQLNVVNGRGLVTIGVNGAPVRRATVSGGWLAFAPLTLQLHAGDNTISFKSSGGPSEAGGRYLSLALRNVDVMLLTPPLPSSCPRQL